MAENDAEWKYHLFTAVAYFMPLLGGWLADRFLGRYKTILYLSFGYVAGHAVIAGWEGANGLYFGLGMIALGAGGIKPCVSAFVGDQFTPEQEPLLTKVYGLFYWMINFGAFFSQLLTPKLLVWYGPRVAFGVPGVLMAIALAVYIAGRRHYVKPPPSGHDPNSFGKVLWYAITHGGRMDPFPPEAIAGVKAVLKIALLFSPIPAFFALFYQYGSTWVIQAEHCNLQFLGLKLESSQISALNGVFVLISIPILTNWVYPWFERRGVKVTTLNRMKVGMYMAVLSFLCAAGLEAWIQAGGYPNVMWQFWQYLIISVAEVLVSATALEFAFTQAPPQMKSSIMGLWFAVIGLGSLLTGVVAKISIFSGAAFYLFFAGLMLVAAVIFAFLANRFELKPTAA
jgi:POT family proton-dependent oligopeptide transporter